MPNVLEAEEAVGFEFNDLGDRAMGLQSLIEMGAGEVIVTSADGCAAIIDEGHERRHYDVEIEQMEADLCRWLRGRVSRWLRCR